MGVWGPHPTSNDTAADWYYPIMAPVAEAIGAVLCQENPDVLELRAACYLLEKVGEHLMYSSELVDYHYSMAIKHLERLETECDFTRDPRNADFLTSVQNQIKNLRHNVEHYAEHGLFNCLG